MEVQARDRQILIKLVKRARSVLDGPLDSIEEVDGKRMLDKLTLIMEDSSHPV